MMCYLCKQTVIPVLEFGENKTFRYVCPCCKSYTEYKSELAELISNKKISKTVGSELLHKLKCATSNLEGSNYEFYKKQAFEEVSKMVVEAKSQISEHINHKIYSVGLEHLMNASEVTPLLNGSDHPTEKGGVEE